MKRTVKMILALSMIVALICSFSGTAFADGTEPEYSISMASISIEKTNIGDNTVTNFNYAGMLAFKNYVEAASSGRNRSQPLPKRIPRQSAGNHSANDAGCH